MGVPANPMAKPDDDESAIDSEEILSSDMDVVAMFAVNVLPSAILEPSA